MRQKFYAVALCVLFYVPVFSQNNVGIGTTTPDASAKLDVTAADKGILIPRVFLTNVNAASPVSSPTASLLVYNSNSAVTGGSGSGFYYWDGTKWQKLFSALDGESWKLLGNAGTNPAVHFIGTTDNQPLNFRVNNLRVGRIDPILFNTFLGAGTGINLAPSGLTSSRKNVLVGDSSGYNLTTGAQNTFVGFRSGHRNTDGFDNTFIGHRAGTLNTASNNTFLGSYAGEFNSTGQYNLFAGNAAGQSNSTGSQNTFVGFFAGINNTTSFDNTFIGFRAGHTNTISSNNTFIGAHAGFWNSSGQFNVFVGNAAGQENTSGNHNTFVGFFSGISNTTGFRNTFVGDSAGYANTTGTVNTFVGNRTGLNNTTAGNNSFFGYEAGMENTTGQQNSFFGRGSGKENSIGEFNSFFGYNSGIRSSGNRNSYFGVAAGFGVVGSTGNENSAFGVAAGQFLTTGSNNSFFGAHSGNQTSSGSDNTFIGDSTGYDNTSGSQNTFVGRGAGLSNSSGQFNVFVGNAAGQENTTGSFNTYVGWQVGAQNTTGLENVAIGKRTGFIIGTGSNNAFFGAEAGRNTSGGSYNVFVGDSSGYINGAGNHNTLLGALTHLNGTGFVNASAIGFRARVDASNSMVLGSISGVNGATASVNVGIGTVAPARTLHVATAGVTGATPMPDAVIVAEKDNDDAFINILTDTDRSSGIGFGNSFHAAHGGIVYNVGLNTYDLRFRTSGNIDRLTIDNVGQVGIGTTTPVTKLHIELNDPGASSPALLVENIGGPGTGEATIALKNIATGDSTWMIGLNETNHLSFAIGTQLNGPATKMFISSSGDVGIATTGPAAKLDVNGTAKIGTNGSVLTNIIKVTVNVDLDGVLGLAATASFTQTVAVANAVVGSTVHISPSSALSGGLVIAYARVSAANTVEIKVTNSGGGPSIQAAMNVFITVIQ